MIVVIALTTAETFAGNGDLIVDGKFGVGTLNPNAKMHINSGDNVVSSILATNNEGPGELRVRSYTTQYINMPTFGMVHSFYNDENNGFIKFHRGGSTDGGFLTFGTYGTERVRIDSGGNVGIGTLDPQIYKLYVAGPAYSTGGWQGSDIKFKKNLLPINDSLGKILKLEGHSYEWKTGEFKEKGFSEGRHYGVIAQEIEKVLPEVVNTSPDGSKAVAYTEIIPVMIEAIKEQQRRIELLEKKLAEAN